MGILLGNSLLRMRNVDFEITGLGLMIPDDWLAISVLDFGLEIPVLKICTWVLKIEFEITEWFFTISD